MQSSDAGKLRDPRVPRIPAVTALGFWAVAAIVFAFLPQGSEWKPSIATLASLSAATFAAALLLRAAPRAQGHERSFLRLMGAGMILLGLTASRQVGSVLIVRIRDDGRGFDTNNPHPGLGLRYMRQRTAEVNADLDVISTPGRGTSVQSRFHNHKVFVP